MLNILLPDLNITQIRINWTVVITFLTFISNKVLVEGQYKTLVVNGKPAKLGEVPYQVSLKQGYKGGRFTSFCGGTIIGPEKVLSAAHCFTKKRKLMFPLERLRVVAGNLKNMDVIPAAETIESGQWREAKNVTWPRHFIFPRHDIAIIFIHGNWTFNDNVKMIGHAKLSIDYSGKSCQISGYGRTGNNAGASEILLKAYVGIKSEAECKKLFGNYAKRLICTVDYIADVHKGDSGGPLVCYDTGDPEEIKGLGVLVGIVSGKRGTSDTFFLRVSTYYNWIERNTKKLRDVNNLLIFVCVCVVWLR